MRTQTNFPRFVSEQVALRGCLQALEEGSLCQLAHAESHGFAVIWNDEIDLAESGIWLNGKVTNES